MAFDGRHAKAGINGGLIGVAWVTGGGAEVRRFGPGVPVAARADAVVTAEEVWRTGLPGTGSAGTGPAGTGPAGRWRRARRWAGTGVSVALIIASVAVIWLRTHHGPLGVSGVTITGQAKSGCTVDVDGRISTNGGSGTVSYEWLFTPSASAPQALRQTVGAGQDAVYVTAAVQGSGHGTVAQQVTLRVLGPGTGSATARVVLSC